MRNRVIPLLSPFNAKVDLLFTLAVIPNVVPMIHRKAGNIRSAIVSPSYGE